MNKSKISFVKLLGYNAPFFVALILCYIGFDYIAFYSVRHTSLMVLTLIPLSFLIEIGLAFFKEAIYKKYLKTGSIKCEFSDYMKEVREPNDFLCRFTIINSIKVCLWSFLFIILGIIKTIEYSRQYVVYAKRPEITDLDELKMIAGKEMEGKKLKLFLIIVFASLLLSLLSTNASLQEPMLKYLITNISFAPIMDFIIIYYQLNNF